MSYVDAFVAAVPSDNRAAYLDMCKLMATIFKDHGALTVVDCWGDDVKDGEVTSFPMAVKCKEGETVTVGWVIWPSKAVRDEAQSKVMSDKRIDMSKGMPFDGKRLIWGGFEVISET